MSLTFKERKALQRIPHDFAEAERQRKIAQLQRKADDMDRAKMAEIFGEQEIPHTSLPEVLLCAVLVAVFLAAFGLIG